MPFSSIFRSRCVHSCDSTGISTAFSGDYGDIIVFVDTERIPLSKQQPYLYTLAMIGGFTVSNNENNRGSSQP